MAAQHENLLVLAIRTIVREEVKAQLEEAGPQQVHALDAASKEEVCIAMLAKFVATSFADETPTASEIIARAALDPEGDAAVAISTLAELKGADPNSPKALGDTLRRWMNRRLRCGGMIIQGRLDPKRNIRRWAALSPMTSPKGTPSP